jgi:hypothetical protein
MVAHPDIEAVYRIEGANFSWNIPAHRGRVERKPIGLGRISRATCLKMMTGNIVRTATATATATR